MLRTVICVNALFVVISASVLADEATATASATYELRFIYPSRSVYSLAFDQAGFLWVGTEADLLRGDGTRFESWLTKSPLPRPNPRVFRLAGAVDGSLWVGMGGSLFRWDGNDLVQDETGATSGLFQTHHGRWYDRTGPNIRNRWIWSLSAGSDGSVWTGDSRCLRRFKDDALSSFCEGQGLQGAYVYAITEDEAGHTFVGTPKGMFEVVGENVVNAGLQEPVYALAAAPGHRMWAGTTHGLVLIENRKVVRRMTVADGLASNVVTALATGAYDTLWVGTVAGVSRLSKGKVQTGKLAAALDETMILALLEDAGGALWIGTKTLGLARLSPRSIRNLSIAQGEPARALLPSPPGIARPAGVWVTSARGLTRMSPLDDPRLAETITPPAKWGPTSLGSMVQDENGVLYLASSGPGEGPLMSAKGGLLRFDGRTWERLTTAQGLPRDDPAMVVADQSGDLWLGWNRGGLARIPRGSFGAATVAANAVESYPPAAVCDAPLRQGLQTRDGDLWFAAYGGGVVRLRPGKPPVCLTEADGLPNLMTTSLLQDTEGTLWVGSAFNGGISRYVGGRFFAVNSDAGLPCDSVHSLVQDGEFLWSACRGGVARVARSELLRWKDPTSLPIAAVTYGVAEGMPFEETVKEFAPTAVVPSPGTLWVATPSGVSVITAAKNKTGGLQPTSMVFEDMTVNGRVMASAGPVDVSTSTLDLRVRFVAPSFTSENLVWFAHRMEGKDATWTLSRGPTRELSYSGLPPGAYMFRVRMSDGAGRWHPHEATFSVRVRLPFYKTWGFRSACFAALAASLFGLMWWRARCLDARDAAIQNERARIARDLHDHIGQSFASLGLHLEALKLDLQDGPPKTTELLQSFGSILAQTRAETRKAIWRLRAETLDQSSIHEALRFLVRRVRADGKRSGPEIVLRIEGGPFSLPPHVVSELAQIALEAISNSLVHAQAKKIVVDLDRTEAGIRVKITDDGKGMNMPVNVAEGHFGLVGMHERASRAGGTVNIHSAPDNGTEVIALVPNSVVSVT